MSITIGSNIASLRTQRQLDQVSKKLGATFERLSSGMRINRSSDDAAGLSVASALNVDTKIYTQAVRNVNDALSAFNIADGAVGTLMNILTQFKGLAEQSANGTYSSSQRTAIDQQGQALQAEYNRLIPSVKFNNLSLLDGSLNQFVTEAAQSTLNLSIGQNMGRTVGQGTFTSGSAQGTAAARTVLATGDFNGDGLTDNVSVARSGTTLNIYIQTNNGNGTFTETTKTASSFGSVDGIAVVDMNNDGKLDIVVGGTANTTFRAKTATLMNNGDGTFGAAATSQFLFDSSNQLIIDSFAVGDVTGDGIPDVAFGYEDTGVGTGIGIARGSSAGSFAQANDIATSYYLPSIAIGDVTGDGKNDLVASNQSGIDVYAGNGVSGATFQAPLSYGAGLGVSFVAIGDINNDGRLDVVGSGGGNLFTFTNPGNGVFSTSRTYSGFTSTAIKLGDLNGDGALDIVSNSNIYSNDGTGVFTSAGTHTTFASVKENTFGIGDTNGDGVPDLIGIQAADNFVYAQIQDTRRTNYLERIDLTTQTSSRTALTTISSYMSRLNLEIGSLGSSESRLGAALNVLGTTKTAFEQAYSQIMSADVAEESANLVRDKILQATASSVLAQANVIPELAITLLKG